MDKAAARPGCAEIARVFLGISLLGFGGPNAHIALMLEEIVERRAWLDREHFLQVLGLTNLLPGPNSSELAIHIGYTQRHWRGALAAGLAFLAPTFLIVVGLSFLYFRFGAVPVVESVFRGVKPVVVAIILGAGWKLARASVAGGTLVIVAGAGLLVAVLLDGWEPALMAAGALVGLWLYRRGSFAAGGPESTNGAGRSGDGSGPGPHPGDGPSERKARSLVLLPLAIVPAAIGELGRLFWLMLWTGSVLFGGGYMLIALLEPHVVGSFGWLTPEQFLDGVAITQAVPGPIVTFVAFIGYAVAGPVGAAIATAGIYIPSFASVLLVAPHLERWRRIEWIRGMLRGVNAAVAGAILGVALTLVLPSVTDVATTCLFALALVAVFRFRLNAIWLITGGLAAGLILALLS